MSTTINNHHAGPLPDLRPPIKFRRAWQPPVVGEPTPATMSVAEAVAARNLLRVRAAAGLPVSAAEVARADAVIAGARDDESR